MQLDFAVFEQSHGISNRSKILKNLFEDYQTSSNSTVHIRLRSILFAIWTKIERGTSIIELYRGNLILTQKYTAELTAQQESTAQ